MSRILVIDTETLPLVAYAWGLRDQNIAINQIKETDSLLCFAVQWVGEKKVHFYSAWEHGPKGMTQAAHKLFNEADAVCGWNSNRFDLPWINRLIIENGLSQPSPYKSIDLMRICRSQFRLPSLKLDYVAQWLKIGRKISTGGMDLWIDVMHGDAKARELMRKYNINDTRLTTEVFQALGAKGWLKGLPNHSVKSGYVCTSCGSNKLHARGWSVTATRRYRRYQCQKCGAWSQSTTCEPGSADLRPAA